MITKEKFTTTKDLIGYGIKRGNIEFNNLSTDIIIISALVKLLNSVDDLSDCHILNIIEDFFYDINNQNKEVFNIGEIIYSNRINLGKLQSELAKEVGCGRSCISAIERGTRVPRLSLVLKLFNVLNIDYETHSEENTKFDFNTFGELLKLIRTRNNISLTKMGKLLGTTKETIKRYEEDLYDPNIAFVTKFCNIFDLNYLLVLKHITHKYK